MFYETAHLNTVTRLVRKHCSPPTQLLIIEFTDTTSSRQNAHNSRDRSVIICLTRRTLLLRRYARLQRCVNTRPFCQTTLTYYLSVRRPFCGRTAELFAELLPTVCSTTASINTSDRPQPRAVERSPHALGEFTVKRRRHFSFTSALFNMRDHCVDVRILRTNSNKHCFGTLSKNNNIYTFVERQWSTNHIYAVCSK